MDDDNTPTADIWADEGKISLVIRHSTVIEYEGELVPGLAFSPIQALDFAQTLIEAVKTAVSGMPAEPEEPGDGDK